LPGAAALLELLVGTLEGPVGSPLAPCVVSVDPVPLVGPAAFCPE